MRMRNLFVALVIAIAGYALGQHSSTTDGRGVFVRDGSRFDIREVTVIMGDNRRLNISMVGNGRHSLAGEYLRDREGVYSIEIKARSDDSPTMTGTIVVAQNYVRSINLRSTTSRNLSFTFTGTGPSTGSQPVNPTNPDNPNDQPVLTPMQLRDRVRGSGDFWFVGRRSNLNGAEVDIRTDGRVFVNFNAERSYTLVGRYTARRGSTLPFTIYDGLGRRNVTGNGIIFLSGDLRTVQRITINGSAENVRFSFNFQRGTFSLDEVVQGRGTVTMGRSRSDVHRIRVILNRDGRFTIRTESGFRTEFNGRWREESNGVISLTVDAIPNMSSVFGNGTIRLEDSGRVARIELSGRANGEGFSLDFRR